MLLVTFSVLFVTFFFDLINFFRHFCDFSFCGKTYTSMSLTLTSTVAACLLVTESTNCNKQPY